MTRKLFEFQVREWDGVKDRYYTEYVLARNQASAWNKARAWCKDYWDDNDGGVKAVPFPDRDNQWQNSENGEILSLDYVKPADPFIMTIHGEILKVEVQYG